MQLSLLLLVLLSLCSSTVSHSNSVYHFINESKSWSEAQQYCRQYYTDLATVYDMTDVERLTAVAKGSDAWIGLYNQTSDNREWHWSLSGVEFKESEAEGKWNIGTGEPNDVDGRENCVYINNDLKWFDEACDKPRWFICYNNASKTYQLINICKNWTEALQYCRENHTDLISGLEQLGEMKIGNDDLAKAQCGDNWPRSWIGLSRDSWGWSDGSSSSFRNWHEDDNVLAVKPQDNNKRCARLDQRKWRSEVCAETKPFICYDKHFILVKENKTWEEALVHCRRQHRDLAWFTNEHLKRGVQERAKMADSEVVWVGLHYTCFLDAWISVNGHYVSEGNWKDPGTNDCGVSGAMERGGGNLWVKRSSQERHNFICAVYC